MYTLFMLLEHTNIKLNITSDTEKIESETCIYCHF